MTLRKSTKATGIKKVVDTFAELTGIDCGCDARKAKLNKLFPRRTQPLCLEEGEYTTLKQFFDDFNGREVKEMLPRAIKQNPLKSISNTSITFLVLVIPENGQRT